MDAFIVAGYTEEELLTMNEKIVNFYTKSSKEQLEFIKQVAIRCDCLNQYTEIIKDIK